MTRWGHPDRKLDKEDGRVHNQALGTPIWKVGRGVTNNDIEETGRWNLEDVVS